MITITKDFVFDSAHFLRDYSGPCANMHGHTYKGNVTITTDDGRLHTDMVMDFKELKQIIQEQIIDQFDHKVINEVIKYNPTAENMVQDIALRMWHALPKDVDIVEVKLWETPDSHATWSR